MCGRGRGSEGQSVCGGEGRRREREEEGREEGRMSWWVVKTVEARVCLSRRAPI